MYLYFPESAPPAAEALEQLWAPHAWIFVAALLCTLLSTPLFRALAMRRGIYDMPDKRLKPHGQPIPYLGGLGIFLGVAVPLGLAALAGEAGHPRAVCAVLLGAGIVVAAGLADDLIGLKPSYKIAAQLAAALVLLMGGVIFRGVPWGVDGFRWAAPDSRVLIAIGLAIHFCLVIGACNATNLLDGLDGLCSGVTAIIAVGFLVMATSIAGWGTFTEAEPHPFAGLIMMISIALFGAALGFLPYNFNPASIFMGDAGSMLMGYLCAVLIIMFAYEPQHAKWFLGAMVIFGLPIFDTGLAFVRRWVNGRPIFAGDRSHFYDQLVDRGLSVTQAVIVCYGLALLFAVLGVSILFVRTRYGILIYLAVFTCIAIAVAKMGMVKVDEGNDPIPPSPQ